MRRYDSRDWFKCDGCEHIFTTTAARVGGFNPASAPE